MCDEARGDGAPRAFTDEHFALFPARWQAPSNPGSALLLPTGHIETIYDVPDDLAGSLMRMLRDAALAVQHAVGADGTTIRQNNRPPGQEIPHLHFHLIPRFVDDDYWNATPSEVAWEARVEQAGRIAVAFRALRAA